MKNIKQTSIMTLLLVLLLSTNAFAESKGNTLEEVLKNAAEKETKDKNTAKQEWYLRLIAEEPLQRLKDKGNVLGHLNDSNNSKDSHDLLELAPFGSRYLTIVFPHPEWGENAGNYTSDYHHPDAYNADEWLFEVRTSAVNSDITLRWEGLYVLSNEWKQKKPKKREQLVVDSMVERMWLEDVDTGERINAVVDNTLQTYTFNMNGKSVKSFRWGLGEYKTVNKNKALAKLRKAQREEIKKQREEERKERIEQIKQGLIELNNADGIGAPQLPIVAKKTF